MEHKPLYLCDTSKNTECKMCINGVCQSEKCDCTREIKFAKLHKDGEPIKICYKIAYEEQQAYKNIIAARNSIAKIISILDKMADNPLDNPLTDIFKIAKAQSELISLLINLETIISDYEKNGKMPEVWATRN